MQQPSLNSITTIIASHLDREFDEPFKRMLGEVVDNWRSTLLGRSLEKHPSQRAIYRQTLFVPMEEAAAVACNVSIPLCNVARSKDVIPTPLRSGSITFDYVGSIDGLNPFRLSSPGTVESLSSGKYSRNSYFYEYTNGYIEVRQNRKLPMIRVDGVFDRPTEVMQLNCKYAGHGCDWWNDPYPVTGDLAQMITQYMLTVDYNRINVPNGQEIEVNLASPKNKQEA